MSKTPARADEVTYLLMMDDKTLKKVTVPASWKVTFGPMIPASKGVASHGETCLRFYKDQQHQMAVFAGVKSFRDMSIKIEERITKTEHETFVRQGDDSGESIVAEVNVHEWQNPDEPKKRNEKPSKARAAIALVKEG